jgi:3-oxoacyl-[acyl-carrier-protein] synthase-3
MAVRLLGVGSAVPSRNLANAEIEKRVDTSDEWIRSRTGIRERRVIRGDEHLVDFIEIASRQALEASGIAASDLDAIVVGTVSGRYTFPATACELQARLGVDRIAAFDVSAACSGFVFALATGTAYVRAGEFRTVLVVGADALTTMVDWTDRRTCVLFGDGAGAVVLRREEGDRGVLATALHASGALADLLYVGAGQRGGFDAVTPPPGDAVIRMKGPELFRWAVRCMSEVALEVLEKAGLGPEAVDIVVPHQANLRIIQAVADKLHFPSEKVFIDVDRYGNTSAASIPIALREAVQLGRLKPGDVALIVACGGGLTWAGAAIRW